MRRGYLRLYVYAKNGERIVASPILSAALLPSTTIPGLPGEAWELADRNEEGLRRAAVELLVHRRKRSNSRVYGIALVKGPARRNSAYLSRAAGRPVSLTATNSYIAAFAAVGDSNTVWAGDAQRETLSDLVTHLGRCVRHVRTEETQEPGMFAPALER